MQRIVLENLFVFPGQTKLNMICATGSDSQEEYGRPYKLDWCKKLKHPPPTTTTRASTTEQ